MKKADTRPDPVIPEFLSGGGEMGERIRNYNWSETSLGPVTSWPRSLRTCIRIMLTSRQPIWIGWGKELIKFYNDPYKAIVGGKHPEALGQPASVVWKDIWRDIEPMLKQVMEKDQGTYVESQLLIMERNGYPEETYYTFSYTPIPGDDGGTAGMICANTDDTERIISERQLKTLMELAKNVAEVKDADDVFEKTIRVLQQNPHDFPFALIYEWNDGVATLQNTTDLGNSINNLPVQIDLKSNDELSQLLMRAADGRKIELLKDVTRKIGAMPSGPWKIPPDRAIIIPIGQSRQKHPYAFLVVGLNPYRLPEPEYLNFFQLVSDQVATSIGNVNRIEEERKRAEALAEIDSAKTIFFSNISHEFRTPLTLMLGPIEDVMNDPDTIVRNRLRMDVAHRNALRLLKLVNTLLDFSKIEANRMLTIFASVDLGTLTRDLASSFRSAIERAGIEYIVKCEPLKETVHVDPDMWEKIVLNVISNAFKYTEQGRIEVSLRSSNEKIFLTVSDTGIGIRQEEMEKIFERFHRVPDPHARSQEGTGIGLSLVQELVKLHRGSIVVDSQPGKGSVFTISIPKKQEHVAHEYKSAKKLISVKAEAYVQEALKWLPAEEGNFSDSDSKKDFPQHQPAKTAKEAHVLLADDNADMRDYLRRLLSEGYHVDVVTNGLEALEHVKQQLPDLIISDVMMPGMNGFDLIRNLKSDPHTANIPVILLSARAGEEATVEGLTSGADDYLTKPFSARELLTRVSSTIRIARSRLAAEKNMYNVFMQTPVAIMVLKGRSHVIELMNEKSLEIVGRSYGSVINKKVFEAIPEVANQGLDLVLRHVFMTGIPYHGTEMPININRHGKMETRMLNFVFEPLYDDDRKITGILGSGVDVTDLVEARKIVEASKEKLELLVAERTMELKAANTNLERSNVELEQFAHVASHDLKEPLRKIKTFAGRLEDEFSHLLPDKGKTYLDKIHASADRMYSMMEGVLAYSSIDADEQQIETVDINQVIQDIQTDLELLIQQKNAVIISKPLPTIEGAAVLIYQLFYNLINNSLKFSRPDVQPTIIIASEVFDNNGKEYVKITISDNGIGFNQQQSRHIFNTFTRLHSRDKYEGTGLGLALSKKIVQRHHGKIVATGVEKKGAEFTITLPLKQQGTFK